MLTSAQRSNASSHLSRFCRQIVLLVTTAFTLTALSAGAPMQPFDGGSRWFNSNPLTPSALAGKVVLVDFWEYTCLNCLRTLPYLREWYRRYRADNFVIVGVQTPEFMFSGEAPHVSENAKRLEIAWPVVLDDRRAIWKRYGVTAWPTEFLFDQNGRLVMEHVGEGDYPEMERAIQELLRKQNPKLALPRPMTLLPQDSYDKPGAVCYPQTPEILIEQTPIANAPRYGDPSGDLEYVDRSAHKDGALYLSGYWRATKEAVVFAGGSGYFLLPYHAIEVSIVMTPGKSPARVALEQDGRPIARADAGSDVHYDASGNSYVDVDASRSYQILMNQRFGQHELRLSPRASGLAIYDMAFESCEVPR